METVYKDWLIDSAKYKERPKEKKVNTGTGSKNKMVSTNQLFSSLEID